MIKLSNIIKLSTAIQNLKYKTIPSYCLKCKKIQNIEIQEFQELVIIKQYCYQNVLYVVVKSQDLLRKQEPICLSSSLGLKNL